MANKPETPKEAQARAKAAEEAAAAAERERQAKIDLANANEILIKQAKDKFAIDQKIAIISAELKRLNELGEDASKRDIMNAKKRLAELKESKKVMTAINEVHLESLETADKEAVLLYDIKSNKKKIEKIDKHIQELKSGALDLSEAETKELLAQAKAQKILLQSNEKLATVTQTINKTQEKLLGLFGTSITALEGMKDAAVAFSVAIKGNILFFAGAAILAGLVLLMGDMVSRAKDLQTNMGGTASQSLNMSKDLTLVDKKLKLFGVNSSNVANSITDSFGTMSSVTADNVDNIGMMERTLGIASNDTAKFAKSFTSLTGESMNTAINTAKMAANLAESNDVAPGKVMADIASSTEEFAAYGKDGGKNIVDAAIAAKKLGLELKTLTRISDTLLDFESSIQSEMEASMLIGKQLNYNKARELALQGDIAGAAQDVMKQVGGAAEFQKLNVIQRKKLAASIGVSVEEMSKLASGELKIKDDKTDAQKLADVQNITVDQLGKVNLTMKLLTAAIVMLTATMAWKQWGKNIKDLFGKMGKSKANPMNWGKKLAKDGSYKGSSKGTIAKSWTKLKSNVRGTGRGALETVKNIKMPTMPNLGVMDKGKAALQTLRGTGRGALEAIKSIGMPKLGMPKLDLMSKGKTALDAVKGVKNVGAVSKLLKFGNMAKGGIGSLVGGLALDYGRGKLDDKDSTLGKSMGIGSAALSGAGTGAMIGSVIPGVGTAVGGAVGGAIGAAMGAWSEYGEELKSWWGGKSKAEEAKAAMEKQTEALKKKTAALQAEIAVKQAAEQQKKEELLKKQEEERKKKEAADKAAAAAAQKAIEEQKKAEALKKQEAQKVVKVTQTDTGTGANRVRTQTRSTDLNQTATTAEGLKVQVDLQRKQIAMYQRSYDRAKTSALKGDNYISGNEQKGLNRREKEITKGQKRLEELLAQLVVATENVGKDVAKQVIENA